MKTKQTAEQKILSMKESDRLREIGRKYEANLAALEAVAEAAKMVLYDICKQENVDARVSRFAEGRLSNSLANLAAVRKGEAK